MSMADRPYDPDASQSLWPLSGEQVLGRLFGVEEVEEDAEEEGIEEP